VTVALCGDGGDELFAGYNRHVSGWPLLERLGRVPWPARSWLGAAMRVVPPGAWDRAYGWWKAGAGRERLLGQKAHKLGRLLSASSGAEMYRTLLSNWERPERFLQGDRRAWDPIREQLRARPQVMLQDLLLADQRFYLPDDLLQKVDRASMAVSLEVRVPILDHRVVEFSWTLPDDLKVRGRVGKWLLRSVLDRHVPRALTDRPKTGFSVPLAAWLDGPLRAWAEELLLSTSATRDTLFERTEVARAWRAFRAGRVENALGIWALVVLESWRRHWGIEDLQVAA
jgi:asparagine synthase (glutamine-hydrolysing)